MVAGDGGKVEFVERHVDAIGVAPHRQADGVVAGVAPECCRSAGWNIGRVRPPEWPGRTAFHREGHVLLETKTVQIAVFVSVSSVALVADTRDAIELRTAEMDASWCRTTAPGLRIERSNERSAVDRPVENGAATDQVRRGLSMRRRDAVAERVVEVKRAVADDLEVVERES